MFKLEKLVLKRVLLFRNVPAITCCSSDTICLLRRNSANVLVHCKDIHLLSSCSQKIKIPNLFLQRNNSNTAMSSPDEEFRHLDYNQLMESRNNPNSIVIDVREKSELDETGQIPGAYHIPLGDVQAALNAPKDLFKKKYNFEKPSPEDTVIFSCRSGKRSFVALEKALASGFKNAKHYKGGWLDWEKHLSQS